MRNVHTIKRGHSHLPDHIQFQISCLTSKSIPAALHFIPPNFTPPASSTNSTQHSSFCCSSVLPNSMTEKSPITDKSPSDNIPNLPSSMYTLQPETLPPNPPSKDAKEKKQRGKRSGERVKPAKKRSLATKAPLLACILAAVTLFWFLGLHVPMSAFWNGEPRAVRHEGPQEPGPGDTPASPEEQLKARVEQQKTQMAAREEVKQALGISSGANMDRLVVEQPRELNMAGLVIVLLVLLGSTSFHQPSGGGSGFCSIISPCCKLMPIFAFPGIAIYMKWEALSVGWLLIKVMMGVHPIPVYLLLKLALDVLCCASMAVLLWLLHSHARSIPPPPAEDALGSAASGGRSVGWNTCYFVPPGTMSREGGYFMPNPSKEVVGEDNKDPQQQQQEKSFYPSFYVKPMAPAAVVVSMPATGGRHKTPSPHKDNKQREPKNSGKDKDKQHSGKQQQATKEKQKQQPHSSGKEAKGSGKQQQQKPVATAAANKTAAAAAVSEFGSDTATATLGN